MKGTEWTPDQNTFPWIALSALPPYMLSFKPFVTRHSSHRHSRPHFQPEPMEPLAVGIRASSSLIAGIQIVPEKLLIFRRQPADLVADRSHEFCVTIAMSFCGDNRLPILSGCYVS